MATVDDIETEECLTCGGCGEMCPVCDNPRERCVCDEFTQKDSPLVDCDDCKGKGRKTVHSDYAPDPAGESDLRDDEPMPAWKVEQITAIQEQERKSQQSESDWLAAKETTKECKEIHDADIATLRRMIRQLDESEKPMPLLDGLDKPTATNGQPTPATDAWRSLPTDILQAHGLSDKIVAKLQEKSLEDLGQLADFQAKHGDFWPKEIKGLGPAKAQQVGEAWTKFLAANPDYCK